VSIEAISAAFKAQGLTASEKLVLLVLADGANHETHQCWPSQKKLAEYTGLSKRTIWAAVDSLTKKGMIKKTGRLQATSRALWISRGKPRLRYRNHCDTYRNHCHRVSQQLRRRTYL